MYPLVLKNTVIQLLLANINIALYFARFFLGLMAKNSGYDLKLQGREDGGREGFMKLNIMHRNTNLDYFILVFIFVVLICIIML